MKSQYFALPKPRILAHRGSSSRFPENTLSAFEAALKFSPYLETDLWMTRDRVPVLHHDADLMRSCGVKQRIAELNFQELKDYRVFSSPLSIPSLEEAIESLPEAFWNIEIKDDQIGTEIEVLRVLQKTGAAERTLIAAEKDEIMRRFRALKSGIPTSASFGEMAVFLQALQQGRLQPLSMDAQAFQIPIQYEKISLASQQLITAAHSLGIEVHYWTVNDPDVAQELLRLGADGIVTDLPEKMTELKGSSND